MWRPLLALTLSFATLVAGAQPVYQLTKVVGNGHPNHYPAGFNRPTAMALGPGGRLYVADTNNDVIQVWFAGSMLAAGEIGRGELSRPMGLAVDRNGRLWVADSGHQRVVSYDVSKPIPQLEKSFSKGLTRPTGIAFDLNGRMLVVDNAQNQLLVFLPGQPIIIQRIGATGADAGQFRSPQGVAVSSNGLIFVSDTGNQRIQVFNPALQVMKILTQANHRPFNQPRYITVDEHQRLYISDSMNNRVVILDAALNTVQELRGGGLRQPWGAVGYGKWVWIGDTANHRIMKLEAR